MNNDAKCNSVQATFDAIKTELNRSAEAATIGDFKSARKSAEVAIVLTEALSVRFFLASADTLIVER